MILEERCAKEDGQYLYVMKAINAETLEMGETWSYYVDDDYRPRRPTLRAIRLTRTESIEYHAAKLKLRMAPGVH